MLARLRPLTIMLALCALPTATLGQDTTAPGTGGGGGPGLALELNKLEEIEGACRAYFIVRNGSDTNLTAFELDTFLFDPDEIILQRLALPFGGVAASKMRIVPFEFQLPCTAIGKLFVNEIITCEAGAPLDCDATLTTSSRAPAALDY
ncbi:MAG: hypothetical protein AAGB11_15020 [Pseudomonadota bacterium]